MDIVGKIVSGDFSGIIIRQKTGIDVELGELLVTKEKNGYFILQVFDISYGSQIPERIRSLAAGLKLEEESNLSFLDNELSNFILIILKPILFVNPNRYHLPKKLPKFFSEVERIKEEDLRFLDRPKKPLYFGKIRSGSRVLEIEVFLKGEEVLTHHVLISASTGKGKSNLVKVLTYNLLNENYAGLLVIDPHDEYYGRTKKGLKDHPNAINKVVYYSTNPPPGASTLVLDLKTIKPWHLTGIVSLTEAQIECIYLFYNRDKDNWIENIILAEKDDKVSVVTLDVLKRKFNNIFGISSENGVISFRNNLFSNSSGISTIKNVVDCLENGKTVILDTSKLGGEVELLIGGIFAEGIFSRYRDLSFKGHLQNKPCISIIIEEAPRVLGKDVLDKGTNIFGTIAREGRKFKVGLVAITQLPSLIPKEILANMNTKIIMGTEMSNERSALIESSPQDISEESRNIASLDIGEALLTSTFSKLAVPLKIPLFEDIFTKNKSFVKDKTTIRGVDLE
ncbi:MAG: AAA-like domain protein [Candidatus Methanofastidiosum methylothiophilum]|uniref:AAA-like domain protein n=1 Tax=Candidatus Methanofastidiosum methylothiophilum TaxID=1705564 RepID=A0A150IT59_9EURY|nr:MAG: AAA-like domain protein [Candidatus Methanofastidiosum methylthiophilus]KYC48112.1 MAG: AAA-like domain protein [Candidatus Methanofastidiosum methylthiophilus]KYC50649.1 MAG: AAA-like domain protein [Candidatus Methanofastidiosum methylthiophilus]